MDNKGVTKVEEVGVYSEGHPFFGAENAIPPISTDEKETPAPVSVAEPEKPAAQRPSGKQSRGMIHAEILKRDGYLPGDMEIPDDADIKDVNDLMYKHLEEKANKDVESKAQEKAEAIAAKYGYNEKNKKYVQMIESGISLTLLDELGRLKLMANTDLNTGDEEVDNENSTILIREMFIAQGLKGKALETAVKNIEPFSDDFEELKKEVKEFWAAAYQARENQAMEIVKSKEKDKADAEAEITSALKKGVIMGIKLTPKQVEDYDKKFFKPTETVVVDEKGKKITKMVSVYKKNLMELENDPEKAAMIMMIISDNLDLNLLIQEGKRRNAQELEDLMSGQSSSFDEKEQNRKRVASSMKVEQLGVYKF